MGDTELVCSGEAVGEGLEDDEFELQAATPNTKGSDTITTADFRATRAIGSSWLHSVSAWRLQAALH
ncbi:MAG: hypothetical protein Q8P61_08960 [Candidatus Nanopelagicales bacterium]|nr:hypothetical protein [Candidatus Nanopelagicales bacterium]